MGLDASSMGNWKIMFEQMDKKVLFSDWEVAEADKDAA
mgnify:CR=1 FL=1